MTLTWTEAARSTELGNRRQNTRTRLLAAAHDVFQELGYEATTVADIVARAAMSRATFYLYFTGKQDIYRANGKQLGQEIADRFRSLDRLLADGSFDEFTSWLEDHVTWAVQHYRNYLVWSEAGSLDHEVSVEVWRETVSRALELMPWYVARWAQHDPDEAFARLGLFIGHLQFLHHVLFTAGERQIALDVLARMWFDELQPR